MSLLPRILAGVAEGSDGDPRPHRAVAGSLPELRRWAPDRLIDEIEQSGLRGRGGAAFPVARKMRAVVARRGSRVVVGNGTEGEPASGKDRLLLTEMPHLVLDGAAVAARAVGADTAIIAFAESDEVIARSLLRAVDERRRSSTGDEPAYELRAIYDGFVSGHESALVNALSGAEAKPAFRARPFERGVRRRPTLVQNVETLAHLALIARHGAGWYRQAGTAIRSRIDARHTIGRGHVPRRLRDRARRATPGPPRRRRPDRGACRGADRRLLRLLASRARDPSTRPLTRPARRARCRPRRRRDRRARPLRLPGR